MLWVVQYTRLKDGCEVRCCHFVQVRLACEYSKKIQDVEQQLAIQWWKLSNETLIRPNGTLMIEFAFARTLCFDRTHGLRLVVSKRVSKLLVKFQRNDGLRKLVEVAPEDICGVVYSKASPIQPFAISVWAVKGDLELLDPLLAPGETENALNIGCCIWELVQHRLRS